MLSLPFVTTHGQPFEIPAPLSYEFFRQHNRNQPEGTQFSQWQFHYAVCDLVSVRFAGQRVNDMSTTNGIMRRRACDAVPVDQCETNTGIIYRDPRSAFGFMRENGATRCVIYN